MSADTRSETEARLADPPPRGSSLLRSRFLWKLYAGYAALILATTVCAALLTATRTQDYGQAQLERQLDATTRLLAEFARPHLASDGHGVYEPAMQRRVVALGNDIGMRLTIVDPHGTVLADSQHDPRKMDNHAGRPELMAARETGLGRSQRHSETVELDMRYHARSIVDDGKLLGLARAAMPLARIREDIVGLRWSVVIAGLVSIVVALPLGLFFARRVTQPLSEMTEVATAIATGDLSRRSAVQSSDEVGRLSRALDAMAFQLAERVRTIEAERNQLEAVLTSMEEGMIAVDRDERITLINLPALRMVGYTERGQTRGKRIWEVCRRDEINRSASATLVEGTATHTELTLTGRGMDRHIDLHATAIHGVDGAVTGAVLVLHDITELRRLETVRRDFVANISHELKTPLTAIRGMVETILDDREMPPALQQRFLGRVLTQAERLSELVGDLLTLSRIESASGGMEADVVDLAAVARISCEQLRAAAEAKRIDLDLRHPEGKVPIEGDQEFLRQVVDNLVDNAIKYTLEGGRVTVELRTTDQQAVLRISDTGIGIAPSDQARVFERFYRVDKARSRELGSTGLGLSIVKHVVLAHRGEIELDSSPGSGSTFTVRLPLKDG